MTYYISDLHFGHANVIKHGHAFNAAASLNDYTPVTLERLVENNGQHNGGIYYNRDFTENAKLCYNAKHHGVSNNYGGAEWFAHQARKSRYCKEMQELEKLGILNLHSVFGRGVRGETLSRGSYKGETLERVRDAGIKVIVDFRTADHNDRLDHRCADIGIVYHHIPARARTTSARF